MSYPDNDNEFEEVTIEKSTKTDSGWTLRRNDGWSFFLQADSPVVPKGGMLARFYGRGIGYPVRGLFLDGVQVFYRTAEQQKEHFEIEMYGRDAADWLQRWDEGRGVWSIEMGGFGPGYEQAIQVTAAECVRHLIEQNYGETDDPEERKRRYNTMYQWSLGNKTIGKLGLSGAQYGAAANLALLLVTKGPRALMTDERLKDRHIQVSKLFPGS